MSRPKSHPLSYLHLPPPRELRPARSPGPELSHVQDPRRASAPPCPRSLAPSVLGEDAKRVEGGGGGVSADGRDEELRHASPPRHGACYRRTRVPLPEEGRLLREHLRWFAGAGAGAGAATASSRNGRSNSGRRRLWASCTRPRDESNSCSLQRLHGGKSQGLPGEWLLFQRPPARELRWLDFSSITESVMGNQSASVENSGAEVSGSGPQLGTNPTTNSGIMCFKCREQGHETKQCTAKIMCLVCGNESHKTEFCTIPKQPKPIAKFVGHAAKGLGCLLIQSAKVQGSKEHVNPLAVITVTEGHLEEQGVVKGFTEMFEWNWTWKAKKQMDKVFVMRFPSKQKVNELQKFGDFSLLGTGCKVNVKVWTHDVTAKGKLHLVWIRLTGVPDTMKNWKGYAEICSSLGVFKSVDVEGLAETGVVRCQVGVRDISKLPSFTETTTEDLLIHEVGVHLDGVIEQGWYNSSDNGKRAVRNEEEMGDADKATDQGSKKARNESSAGEAGENTLREQQSESRTQSMNLEGLSELQIQQKIIQQQILINQLQKQHEQIQTLQQKIHVPVNRTVPPQADEVGDDNNMQQIVGRLGLGSMSLAAYEQQQKQLQTDEAGPSNFQPAPIEKLLLPQNSFMIQEIAPNTAGEVALADQEKDKETNSESGEEVMDSQNNEERVNLSSEGLDFEEDTQGTPFEDKVKKIQAGGTGLQKQVEKTDANKNKEPEHVFVRRCQRFASQEGQKIEERAVERAKLKNLCADAGKRGRQDCSQLGSQIVRAIIN